MKIPTIMKCGIRTYEAAVIISSSNGHYEDVWLSFCSIQEIVCLTIFSASFLNQVILGSSVGRKIGYHLCVIMFSM